MNGSTNAADVKARAESRFKLKEARDIEGRKASSEAEQKRVAVSEKTVRLRALREAKEAADRLIVSAVPKAKRKRAKAD